MLLKTGYNLVDFILQYNLGAQKKELIVCMQYTAYYCDFHAACIVRGGSRALKGGGGVQNLNHIASCTTTGDSEHIIMLQF